MSRISILEYGAGNLHSLSKALELCGATVSVTASAEEALRSDLLVLPGVGNFAQAASCLASARDDMTAAITRGLPTLGICLGMQLLFDASDEGVGAGLGVIPGNVRRLRASRIPQIGWNAVDLTDAARGVAAIDSVYYANSYACDPHDEHTVMAWSTHERDRFPALVRLGAAVGVQFHPEKSGTPGVRFLGALVAGMLQ